MSLLQDSSVQSLLEQGYFSSSDFDLIDILNENITIQEIMRIQTEIGMVRKNLLEITPPAFKLETDIQNIQKEIKDMKSKITFSWFGSVLTLLLQPLIAAGVVTLLLMLVVLLIAELLFSQIPDNCPENLILLVLYSLSWVFFIRKTVKNLLDEYKTTQQYKQILSNKNTALQQLLSKLQHIKKQLGVKSLVSCKYILINLDALDNFLKRLGIVLTDSQISQTERLLAIDSLFANLHKQKHDKLVLAATLETAAHAQRQAEAAELQARYTREAAAEQARYAREAMNQQATALAEQNRKLEEQTKIIKEKARLDESRRQDGQPWKF